MSKIHKKEKIAWCIYTLYRLFFINGYSYYVLCVCCFLLVPVIVNIYVRVMYGYYERRQVFQGYTY